MIIKAISGSGFLGTMLYLFHGHRNEAGGSKNARIIGGNMAGESPRTLSREFGQLRKLRPNLGKAVAHFSVSFSPEERSINDEELGRIAAEFMAGMGFERAAYTCIRHHDTAHQHAHIVACRASLDGKTISDSHTYRRAESVARQLEIKHGLLKLTTTNDKEADMQKNKTFTPQHEQHRAKEEIEEETVLQGGCGDDLTDKEARELRRLALSDEYQQQLITALGTGFKSISKTQYGLAISTTDGGRLIDRGNTVQAYRMSDEAAAKRLVAIGKVKGWTSMRFTGSPEFLRLAFREAVASGVTVVPIDELQFQILLGIVGSMQTQSDPHLCEESRPVVEVVVESEVPPTLGSLDGFSAKLQARREVAEREKTEGIIPHGPRLGPR